MIEPAGPGRVVVAYDGRWQSPCVLEFAAKAADRLDLPLSIVTLYRSPDDVSCLDLRPLDGWNPRPAIARSLQRAQEIVRSRFPAMRVTTHVVCDTEVAHETEPFRSASLLVLGERHARTPDPGAVRTASAVLREATACSVVVVQESALVDAS